MSLICPFWPPRWIYERSANGRIPNTMGANRARWGGGGGALAIEAMLQLGMVADACEIGARSVRHVDTESVGVSALFAHVEYVRASAQTVFQNGRCLEHRDFVHGAHDLLD